MNLSPARKSQKPKPRPRSAERRAFTPGVDRLEPRVSLSGLGLTGSTTQGPGWGLSTNHNETLVRARPQRKRAKTALSTRRALAPAVEGLERRVSLSGLTLSGGFTHGVGLVQGRGTTVNHNETLVRGPRRGRRR